MESVPLFQQTHNSLRQSSPLVCIITFKIYRIRDCRFPMLLTANALSGYHSWCPPAVPEVVNIYFVRETLLLAKHGNMTQHAGNLHFWTHTKFLLFMYVSFYGPNFLHISYCENQVLGTAKVDTDTRLQAGRPKDRGSIPETWKRDFFSLLHSARTPSRWPT